MGITYILTVVAGYVSDVYVGHRMMMFIAVSVYCTSLVMLTTMTFLYDFVGSDNMDMSAYEVLFWITMLLQTIGTGGLRSNVAAFGEMQLDAVLVTPDQSLAAADDVHFDETNSESRVRTLKRSYWMWYYWQIHLGGVCSYLSILNCTVWLYH